MGVLVVRFRKSVVGFKYLTFLIVTVIRFLFCVKWSDSFALKFSFTHIWVILYTLYTHYMSKEEIFNDGKEKKSADIYY